MSSREIEVPGLPIGYRFLPSQEVLIRNYLKNKNLNEALPADVLPDIHVDQLYAVPPHQFVAKTLCTIEDEWYYYVLGDPYFCAEKKEEQIVGSGDGFWRVGGEENPIIDSESVDKESVLGYNMRYGYFAGPIANHEITEWKMEKYRLPYNCDEASKGLKEGWVIARIIKGAGYVMNDVVMNEECYVMSDEVMNEEVINGEI